jgi:hypothetical protein
MIPSSLNDWTLNAVCNIAVSGITENDVFDLKADLQPAEQQRKIVAAFANTRGGYLVFGVNNNRQLIGVQNAELPRDFGTKLRTGIEPAVDYRVANPITVAPGRFIFVVEVPRSPRVPHAVFLNNSWVFLKRTAGGSNDAMSYEEIRLAFQDTETKRSKLALVSSELQLIEAIAERAKNGIPEDFPPSTLYRWSWVTRYPTTLLDSLLGDAFSLLARDTDVWGVLAYLRDLVRVTNTLSETLSELPFSAISGVDEQKQAYQKEIRRNAVELTEKCKVAREAISKILGPTV